MMESSTMDSSMAEDVCSSPITLDLMDSLLMEKCQEKDNTYAMEKKLMEFGKIIYSKKSDSYIYYYYYYIYIHTLIFALVSPLQY